MQFQLEGRGNFLVKPVLVGYRLYMISDGCVATSLKKETGAQIRQERLGGEYSGSPVAVEGRIYFFNMQGTTTVVRAADRFEILATNRLENGFRALPAVVGKALYLRTKTDLYRVEK